jgi:hypothetical protein
MFLTTRQILMGCQIKEDEIGGACSTHWGEAYTKGLVGNEYRVETQGVYGRIILKWVVKK